MLLIRTWCGLYYFCLNWLFINPFYVYIGNLSEILFRFWLLWCAFVVNNFEGYTMDQPTKIAALHTREQRKGGICCVTSNFPAAVAIHRCSLIVYRKCKYLETFDFCILAYLRLFLLSTAVCVSVSRTKLDINARCKRHSHLPFSNPSPLELWSCFSVAQLQCSIRNLNYDR